MHPSEDSKTAIAIAHSTLRTAMIQIGSNRPKISICTIMINPFQIRSINCLLSARRQFARLRRLKIKIMMKFPLFLSFGPLRLVQNRGNLPLALAFALAAIKWTQLESWMRAVEWGLLMSTNLTILIELQEWVRSQGSNTTKTKGREC